MRRDAPRPDSPELHSLILSTREDIRNCLGEDPAVWMIVDSDQQRLFLVREGHLERDWEISTAARGLDNREGSGGTPPGVHRVAQKIGREATPGSVFVSREPTGEIWSTDWNENPELAARDFILTRILVLDGCEEGVNQGPGIDSRERYIYVHGTNREDLLGRPVSHGCVRMANQAVAELFDQIEEGAPLVIV